MDAKQWALIESHFQRIVDLPQAEKTGELDKIQTQIPEIYEDLIALLAEDDSPHTLFHLREVIDKEEDKTGEQIANYRLLKLLGKGGMGEVYLAERVSEDFHQEVALKLVRSNYNKKDLTRYFQNERQILAGLKHKNIAALYDGGGSEEGMPYFTMEYVEGLPFNQYIEEKELGLADRLRLFLQVCDAVAYSHQKLLAHLDLKPGNIIVNEQGECKLLDFGIAGMPEKKGKRETMRFTPAYASPEQLRGESLASSSDIYSLGIILYELMYDKLPRNAQENTLAGWKALSTHLPTEIFNNTSGDLAVICKKALEEKPEERYSSVEQMGNDIRAYLSQNPISLKKQNKPYVLRKYLSRNRSIIAISLAGILALGITVFSYTQQLAEERNTAQKEAKKANQISSFMFSVFDGANPYENRGKEVTAKQLLKKALLRMPEELAEQKEVLAEMTTALGQIAIEMGEYELADSLSSKALELLSKLEKPEPVLYADAWLFRADYLSQMGTPKEEGKALEEARLILMEKYGENDTLVANYLERLASNAYYQGNFPKADSLYRALINTYRKIYEDPRKKIVYPLTALGEVNNVLNNLEEADSILRIAVDMVSEVYPSPHTEIAYTTSIMSSVQYNRGNFRDALKYGKISHNNSLQIYGAKHKQRMDSWVNVARVYTGMDLYDSAIYVYDSLRILSAEIYAGTDDNYYGQLTQSLANVYENMGELDKAEELLLEAMPILERNLPKGHPTLIFVNYSLGKVYLDQKKYAQSKKLLEKGLAICTDNLGDEHPRCGLLQMALGKWYKEKGDKKKAIEYLKNADANLGKWPQRYKTALNDTRKILAELE